MPGAVGKQIDRPALRIAIATAVVMAAFLLRQALGSYFGAQLPPFIVFYPTVMCIALLFGLWPGLVATALATLLSAIWIIPPIGNPGGQNASNIVALALFFGMGVFMSLVADRFRRYQRRVASLEKQGALREASAQLEEVSEYRWLALEASGLGAWEYHPQTGKVLGDESFHNGFGFASNESIEYDAAVRRIHHEDRPAFDEAVRQAIAGENGGAYHREFRVEWPDGSMHWISSHGRVYFEGEGDQRRPRRFIGVNADVSQRKKVEEDLRQAELDWERTFASVPDLIAILDNEHHIVRANQAMARRLGATPEACVGQTCFGAVHGTSAPIESCPHILALLDGREHVAEVHESRLGGDFVVSTTPLFDDRGQMVGAVHVARDITERKAAEEQLKRLNRALKALSKISVAILQATDELAFLQEACRIVTEDSGYAMAWIGFAEDDEKKTVRPVAHAGFDEKYLDTLAITWDDLECPTGAAIRTGEPAICRNMNDPTFIPWREEAARRGNASSLAIPLGQRNGTRGAITIYSFKKDAFSEPEVALLKELAGNLEFGIHMLATRDAQARAEEALRESEARLELFVDHAPAALAMFDDQMRYLYASRRWRSDYGLGNRDLRNLSHYDVFPEIPERWRAAHRRALAGEVQSSQNDRFQRADGSLQWIKWEIRPWHNAGGKVGGILIFSEDVTARRHAEEELNKLNRTLKAISDTNEALLRATNEQAFLDEVCLIITQVCGHAMVWVGAARNDDDKAVWPVACAGSQDGYLEALQLTWHDSERGRGPTGTAIRTGKPSLCRNLLADPGFFPWREQIAKSGYASMVAIPLKVQDEPIGAITIYSRELDAFSKAELDLLTELADDLAFGIRTLRLRAAHARAEEALHESEARFRSVLDDSRDVIYRFNLQKYRYEYISPSACAALGYPMDELMAMDFDAAMTIVHPDDHLAIGALSQRLGETGKEEGECRLQLKNGEYSWFSILVSLVKDSFGRPLYQDGILRDITARKKAEDALLRSEKLASVGHMAASISHEINNPLAAVTNLLFLAQAHDDLPAPVRQLLDIADSEMRRITHITRQSLGFYHESNAPALVSIGAVLDSAVDLMKSKIKAKQTVIGKEWNGKVELIAVAGELRQVFSNLLANSLDAIDLGGTIRLRVTTGQDFRNDRRCVRIAIADDGKGIDPRFRERIFEPFFTTKGSVGTGLGLWVTKQIIEKHNGTVTMRSSIDGAHRGTVFQVVLPLDPAKSMHTDL